MATLRPRLHGLPRCVLLLALALWVPLSVPAQAPQTRGALADSDTLEQLTRAVVGLTAEVPPRSRTAGVLGTHREGNGVVIDDQGRVLTIGYLVLEASQVHVTRHDGKRFPAQVLGYDAASGLGLLQVVGSLELEPLPLGDSSTLGVRDPVLVLTRKGATAVHSATVASRRNFAGYWEYLLEDAIYTTPPWGDYAGAALLDRDLRLVGIGSLYVENAAGEDFRLPGNLFVPIARLAPVKRDLVEVGRPRTRARPWMGVNVAEQFGRVVITRVTAQGPAREAGLAPGDIILEVDGGKVRGLEDFYRKLWGLGDAGVVVRLRVLQRNDLVTLRVATRDRYGHYRMPQRN